MAYLTDVNHNDSDSDDLPAVDTVLHGNGIARNQNSMHATGGSRNGNARDIRIKSYRVETRAIGGSMIIQRNGYKEMKNNCNSKVNKRFEEDVHASILEKKSARRFRQVILDESDEEDNDELEVENDGKDAGRPVPVTKESMLSVDERHTRKGEMTKKGSNTSETAHISQIWKSIHASRYSESDEETDLEGKGDLETRFANIRLLCDRNGSNKSCDGSRLSLSSKIIGLGAGSGQRGRPTTPEQNPPIRGDQDSNERSEAKPETKSRLISPTKRKQQQQQQQQQQHPRIHSASEFRESGETFWRQSFINQWNDSYSPDKKILSPKKFISDEQHDFSKLPNFSGRGQEKNSVIVKPDREAARQKKLFRVTKQKTAEAFLAEVDQEVTGGRIGELCRNTGGVNLIWSKKLVSTAGRAQWKRIKPKTENSNHEVSTSEQHYASIELAEKVIDNDNRLKNVIAHEFCHLANFMISGVKDNPHGKSFKEWARKCSNKFAPYGVEVTTRHSYDIDYKYIWQCLSCDMLFKRHSKSIDPKKQACGLCTSKLVQVKPTPRNGNQTDYQLFIKSHFQNIKMENPKASHASIMQILSSRYRGEREITASAENDPRTLEKLNGKLRDLTV